LVQSHDDHIALLPAIPSEWRDGAFTGVCVRGGFTLNFEWKNSKITTVKIYAKADMVCRMKVQGVVRNARTGKTVKTRAMPGGILQFDTVKGETYTLDAR